MNYNDPSFTETWRLRMQANQLNLQILRQTYYSTTRPSKQSRKEAHSRIAYLIKQRNALLNLYPEFFI